MNLAKTVLGALIVSILVAVIYVVFEELLSSAIHTVWFEGFDIENNRFAIIPLVFAFVFLFFAAQHYLDSENENKEHEGLGDTPKPTLHNLGIVLLIGFLSLFSGASLGPEAILVPASLIVGVLVARAADDKKSEKLFSLFGFVALFTAFFTSVWGGLLGFYLGMKTAGKKWTFQSFSLALLVSLLTLGTLHLIEAESYIPRVNDELQLNVLNLVSLAVIGIVGYYFVYGLEYFLRRFKSEKVLPKSTSWTKKAFVVSSFLALIYFAGGHLVMFTGNESIVPMFSQARELGLIGLLVLIILKLLAIAWSHYAGLRGGLVFPMVFVAAAVTAIFGLYIDEFPLLVGVIVGTFGMVAANQKSGVLF